jgi:type IV pilus assembly protein PilE
MRAPSEKELSADILAYMLEHPNALDEVQGIAAWWFSEERMRAGVGAIERVLKDLVVRGMVVAHEIPGGRTLYYLTGTGKTTLSGLSKRTRLSRTAHLCVGCARRMDNGFSLTELMIVLVIIGVLVLLALPKLMPVVTKAKTTEAKLMLKQVQTLEQAYKFEHDRYSMQLGDIGFDQETLISQGGQARYRIELLSASEKTFLAHATSVVDFDNDGTFNVWEVDQTGSIREKVPD